MQGFNVSESGHGVLILPPQNISGGVTTQPFSMKLSGHVSILVQFGQFGAVAPTSLQVLVLQSATASPLTVGQAIPFRYYYQTAPGTAVDTLSPPLVAPAAGITTFTRMPNNFLWIEIDAPEITNNSALSDSDAVDYPYMVLSIVNGSNAIQASAFAILSGNRFQYQGNASVTA